MNDIQTFNTDYKKSHNRNFHILLIGIITIAIIVIILMAFFAHHNNPYDNLNNTQNLSNPALLDLRNKDAISSKLEYDFTYLKGCPHCNSVKRPIIKGLNHQINLKNNIVVLNARQKNRRQYLNKNQLYSYPTISVRYHGYLIYQYSGMNKSKFKSVLHGINPYTERKFSKKVPEQSVKQNSFTERTTREDSLPLKNFTD